MNVTSMTLWNEIRRDSIPEQNSITLGKMTSYTLRSDPKHILFSLARYKHASKLLPLDRSANVLELGCGDGFGTSIIAQFAKNVVAVDGDKISIADAKKMPGSNIQFIDDDFLNKIYGVFDAVISLDVIEHIDKEIEDKYFSTIVSNLNSEKYTSSICIIGTPNVNSEKYACEINKKCHVNLYSAERLYNAMSKYFCNTIILGINDETIHTGFFPMCHYLLAAGFGLRNHHSK